jgi:ribosome-associated protein
MSKSERRPGTEPDSDEWISKSERKRRAHRLQALGRELAALKADEMAELGLPDALRTALLDYQRFPSHEAKRRQLQFIGRVMRDVEIEPLQAALDNLHGQSAEARYEQHLLERWRDRLLAEPDALTEFLAEYPGANSQQLRHHIRQVEAARTGQQQRTAYRALFRFLRDETHPA